jgi:hypothetical protein
LCKTVDGAAALLEAFCGSVATRVSCIFQKTLSGILHIWDDIVEHFAYVRGHYSGALLRMLDDVAGCHAYVRWCQCDAPREITKIDLPYDASRRYGWTKDE